MKQFYVGQTVKIIETGKLSMYEKRYVGETCKIIELYIGVTGKINGVICDHGNGIERAWFASEITPVGSIYSNDYIKE